MSFINDKPIKVEGKEGKKTASSAEAAVREIEEKAQELNRQDNIPPNILRMKDPNSRFITANDVMREHQALKLGITRETNRSNRVMSDKPSHSRMKAILDNSKQSCPVCSIELNSPYPMEWIESAEIFRCVRCTLTVNPFAVEDEPLPEEPTNFGLSAIHDINKDPITQDQVRRKFPMVSRRKKKDVFTDLDKQKQDYSVEKRLKRKFT